MKTAKKLGINSDKNFPVLSILDTNLIKTALPMILILQSAIASLVRSIETYTSVDANQLTKFFSIKSFELIINAFKEKNKSTKFYKIYNGVRYFLCLLYQIHQLVLVVLLIIIYLSIMVFPKR